MQAPAIAEPEEQAAARPGHARHELRRDPRAEPDAATLGRRPPTIATIRRTATIRRGTRMIKLLSARQFSALPARPPAERVLLPRVRPGRSCARRPTWRCSLGDAHHRPDRGEPSCSGCAGARSTRSTTTSRSRLQVGDLPAYAGLTAISPHDRLGPPVLGTGFAPEPAPPGARVRHRRPGRPADARRHLAGRVHAGRHRGEPLPLHARAAGLDPDVRPAASATCCAGLPEISIEQEYVQMHDRPHRRVHLARSVPGRDVRGDGRPAARVPGAGQGPGRPLPGRVACPAGPGTSPGAASPAPWSGSRATGARLRLCRPDRGTASTSGRSASSAACTRPGRPRARSAPVRDVDQTYAGRAQPRPVSRQL